MSRLSEARDDLESAERFEHWTHINYNNAPSREARLAKVAWEAAKQITGEKRQALDELLEDTTQTDDDRAWEGTETMR